MRDTLFFDGECGMCTRSVRWLRRLDWLGRLDYADSTRTPVDQLPVRPDVAMTGIPIRTRTGRVLVGYPALRRALLQTPLGCVPALLGYVPGISHLGTIAYNAIAARRRRSPRACAVDPVARQ